MLFTANPIYFIDPTGLKGEDWVKDANGKIKWDKDANSKETTKEGETYLGTTLEFEFKSYIDAELWDGPTGDLAAGVKLTSTIYVEGMENSKGELIGISSSYKVKLGNTPIGKPRAYYPGLGKGQNKFKYKRINTKKGFTYNLVFEQHASVSKIEEITLNALAYDIVNVAQQLTINYSNNVLTYSSATDVFPSATLNLNGSQVMYYPQPSFVKTHKFPKKWINDYFYYYWNDYKYLPAKLYKR